jgi:hypothetical protein
MDKICQSLEVVSDVDSYGAAPESDSYREAEVTADFEAAEAALSEDDATINNLNSDDSSAKKWIICLTG